VSAAENTPAKPTPKPSSSSSSSAAAAAAAAAASYAEPAPQSGNGSAFTPTRNALVEKLRQRVVEVPLRNSLETAFENAFTVNHERISTITNMLKMKQKWDFKEKEKRQTMVIKELKVALAYMCLHKCVYNYVYAFT
jgi:hypothetical protein